MSRSLSLSPVRRLAAGLAALVAALSLALASSAAPAEAVVRVIPCSMSGPTVFTASAGVLGSTARLYCPGATRVTVRLQWYRNGVLVGSNWAGGYNSATTTAGTRCIRGGSYQPIAFVTASAPNAVPLAQRVTGPYGRFCG